MAEKNEAKLVTQEVVLAPQERPPFFAYLKTAPVNRKHDCFSLLSTLCSIFPILYPLTTDYCLELLRIPTFFLGLFGFTISTFMLLRCAEQRRVRLPCVAVVCAAITIVGSNWVDFTSMRQMSVLFMGTAVGGVNIGVSMGMLIEVISEKKELAAE